MAHAAAMCAAPPFLCELETQLPQGLELLRQMVNINSYTANPEGVNLLARLTAAAFAPLGFDARFVPSANPSWGEHLVLTRLGRGRRTLAMISHLDTVFPPEEEQANDFRWRVEGDCIFGPGTHDIKGGTVMMWLVLSALRAQAPAVFEDFTWKLLWNSAEECFAPDFGQLCQQELGPGTEAALVFEAEGRAAPGRRLLVVARKGRAEWRATVRGRGAHAGGAHAHGANALVQLGLTVQQIAALTDYTREVTFNVGFARGGTVLNRVPHLAIAEGEFRAFTPDACARARAALLHLAGPGNVRSPDDGYACEVNIEVLSESPPWPPNPATDNLFSVWQTAGQELGIPVAPQQRGGLSDGNLLWDRVPTLDGLGPWGENDHCSERSPDGSKMPEFVEISSFVPKAALNCLAIVRLAAAQRTSQPKVSETHPGRTPGQ